ncbi:hypothetical protein [Staphylococcus sp. HMSC056G08]|uniref:hypothetical protein n=1 Tax=Staphylococcus sp. HMSC056G08 TaxID=1739350 RepID=UPI0008A53FD3|nr:hypothetical protein [Staphylococcus sp. HMSC056G08]OFJ77295.1 hypothetical protein HMPREF2846_10270 [Staphylococcus sp. HMSC056G08]
MDLEYWLPIIILFIIWAYTLYKWLKTERELNQSREEIQRYREKKIKDENNLLNYLKFKRSIIQELPEKNGSMPTKVSFVLKSENGRYFQDVVKMYVNNENLTEKVMQTTDDISKAKEYRTHREASEEATKYDLKVLALNTYVKEL